MTAMQSGSVPPPQATPPITTPPVVSAPTMAAGIEATHGPVDTPANTSGAPPASTGTTGPVAPTVVTAGPVAAPAAPVVGGSAVPAGPLPAYGSDLRPPVVAAPAVPSVPTAPVSARAAEQQRLQRIVDAVARQEPRISWAAGLRDDGTTTLLVTDLAGGWIPPHVRLPANVTLLEPTARRRDADVIDLLGAVVAVAAHESNTYVAEPGPDAPALTGDRSARSAIPKVDEFGPTLVEAVRRRDSLPRIAQAIALPAVRKTGVLENEAELLHGCITAVKESVLKAYPSHELTAVGDWMLLAAIEALIDEQDYLANYHLAWYAVTTRRGGSRGFAA
ncbi:putative transmembrane protein [Mycobacterium tuberculosis]|nr:putative transmembrane protein [Mycobacterium tuberculosis]